MRAKIIENLCWFKEINGGKNYGLLVDSRTVTSQVEEIQVNPCWEYDLKWIFLGINNNWKIVTLMERFEKLSQT